MGVRTVHPHGRGDNVPLRTVTTSGHGSPPRAWGQWPILVLCRRVARFTPTGVGTMSDAHSRESSDTVHPHGRGDNLTGRYNRGRTYGSPPRAWGQSQPLNVVGCNARFTPTGVGTIVARRTGA